MQINQKGVGQNLSKNSLVSSDDETASSLHSLDDAIQAISPNGEYHNWINHGGQQSVRDREHWTQGKRWYESVAQPGI